MLFRGPNTLADTWALRVSGGGTHVLLPHNMAICSGRPYARKALILLRCQQPPIHCPHVWPCPAVRHSSRLANHGHRAGRVTHPLAYLDGSIYHIRSKVSICCHSGSINTRNAPGTISYSTSATSSPSSTSSTSGSSPAARFYSSRVIAFRMGLWLVR